VRPPKKKEEKVKEKTPEKMRDKQDEGSAKV
jgi:hypothetical protein